jgi:hypothetical protein
MLGRRFGLRRDAEATSFQVLDVDRSRLFLELRPDLQQDALRDVAPEPDRLLLFVYDPMKIFRPIAVVQRAQPTLVTDEPLFFVGQAPREASGLAVPEIIEVGNRRIDLRDRMRDEFPALFGVRGVNRLGGDTR